MHVSSLCAMPPVSPVATALCPSRCLRHAPFPSQCHLCTTQTSQQRVGGEVTPTPSCARTALPAVRREKTPQNGTETHLRVTPSALGASHSSQQHRTARRPAANKSLHEICMSGAVARRRLGGGGGGHWQTRQAAPVTHCGVFSRPAHTERWKVRSGSAPTRWDLAARERSSLVKWPTGQ